MNRSFQLADQAEFATLSGDVNPMHVDAVAARRLIAGRPVVHGIHTLLRAFEAWPAAQRRPVGSVQCDFAHPVSVGDEVDFHATAEDGGVQLLAQVGPLACMQARLGLEVTQPAPEGPAGEPVAVPGQPLELPLSAWLGRVHRVMLAGPAVAQHFAAATEVLGETRVRGLATLSTIVGMLCPGLHSIFSSLSLRPEIGTEPFVTFELRRWDARFPLQLHLGGAVRGELRAFVRPPPQRQPAAAELAAEVGRGEFAGTRMLVIGGSRGLGEVAAKLLAAGGADVTITWAAGSDDAQAVARDIASLDGASCQVRQLRVGVDDLATFVAAHGPFDGVLYFATPRIFRRTGLAYDSTLHAEFAQTYVEQFARLCLALEAAGRPVRVYVPSSTAVQERPRGMTEYAMAKAAAEVLADDLNRTLQHVRIVHARVPRMATDQTATLIPVKADSAARVLLPALRELAPGR